MKKHYLFIAILFLTYTSYAQIIGSWATKKTLGNDISARENAGMVSLNNKLYILGGDTNSSPHDFTEYNPSTGELIKLKEFPAGNPVNNRILFAVQGKIYSFTPYGHGVTVYDFNINDWTFESSLIPGLSPDAGFVIDDIIYLTSQSGNNFYAYNTITNTFTQKANYPGSPNRRQAFGFDINGKGYFGSGRTTGTDCGDADCFTDNFYEYNPTTDTWTIKANFPYPTANGSGIGSNGKGYAGLGDIFVGFGLEVKKSSAWYEYDPIIDAWAVKQPLMNSPVNGLDYGRAASSIAKSGNEVFIFGGRIQITGNFYCDDLFKYDIITNNWQIVNDDLGKNRKNASGFYYNGKIYIGSGEDSEGLNDFWEYNVATDQWSEKTGIGIGGDYSERSCVEINGKGYFIGGYTGVYSDNINNEIRYSDALLEYDPTADLWTEKTPYPAGKRTGMVSFSYNGKLYSGLGRNVNGAPTSNFYEYNTVSNTWTSLSNAPIAGSHLSYFVLNDNAYIVSILANNPTIVYKYNFSLDTWTTEPCPITTGSGVTKETNQAFTYNGKGYVVNSPNLIYDQLSEFDSQTGIWKTVMNLPFSSAGGSIVASPDGVYFGFGKELSKGYISNSWQQLRFNAGVSDNIGVYYTNTNNNCGTGILGQNATQSIYDEQGDLFLTLKSGDLISNSCVEVNSIDLDQNFRTAVANFGNGFQENGMFLNKSVLFKNNSGIAQSDALRLYYKTAELNKLVQDFNNLYNTNKTTADIKFVVWNIFNDNDNDPLNNTNGAYVLYSPTLQEYGPDYYVEISPSGTGSSIGGEVYAVLLLGTTLESESFGNVINSLYPNPTSSLLNIETKNNSLLDKIVITDLTGKIVFVQTQHTNQINVEHLSSGIYILEAFSGNEKSVHKFIKN